MEEICVRQPKGYEIPGKEHHVYKLRKALYGLKQAPRAWYSKLDKSLVELGLIRSNHKPAIYYNPNNLFKLYIGVYADDFLVVGIQVNQLEGEITLAQSSYALKILSDFNFLECNSSQTPLEVNLMLNQDDSKNIMDSTTYRSLMGSLRSLMHIRLDLMFCT